MTDIIENILFAKTQIWHFFIAFILSLIFCSVIYILLVPLFYFLCFGSGESSLKVIDLPINIFVQDWFALIITVSILLFLLIRNVKAERLGQAKSYLVVIFLTILLYLFKIPIGNKFIGLF